MTESVCCFGPDDGLVGVVSDPDPVQARGEAPAVIFLNAGLLHHVGPFCWYTTLARRLCESGATTLRFDLAGVGESHSRIEHSDNLDCAIRDVQAAMDFLTQTRSIRQFVLLGLCSGAILAHHVSVKDHRVTGIIALDGISYHTTGFRRRQLLRRLLRPKSWMTAIKTILRKWTHGRNRPALNSANQQLAEMLYFQRFSQEEIQTQLVSVMRRGMRHLQIYTQTAFKYFNHVKQYREMFGQLPDEDRLLEVDHMKDADHMFSNLIVRLKMFERVESWYWRGVPSSSRLRDRMPETRSFRESGVPALSSEYAQRVVR